MTFADMPIAIYAQPEASRQWLETYRGCRPLLACVLGFTATGLIPGISAAGATPQARRTTAIADAEFLVDGVRAQPTYPLPPLEAGISPTFISRAVLEALNSPLYVFDAGLPCRAAVPTVDLGGIPANCLTTGAALPETTVEHLFAEGWKWGETLGREAIASYVVLGECVVGGTTTALAVLAGLGFEAAGKVNSSHPRCNHEQKWATVRVGLERANLSAASHPLQVIAAVGDPMQVAAAAIALGASRYCGVLLAGGTQMLAVRAIIDRLARSDRALGRVEQIVVGTTRWVAEDPTGDTVGLARLLGDVPLLATQLSFAASRYPQMQAYERGFVKEGVGAGGCAIAAHLALGWQSAQLLDAIESLVDRYTKCRLATEV